jgi:hypothetical protein
MIVGSNKGFIYHIEQTKGLFSVVVYKGSPNELTKLKNISDSNGVVDIDSFNKDKILYSFKDKAYRRASRKGLPPTTLEVRLRSKKGPNGMSLTSRVVRLRSKKGHNVFIRKYNDLKTLILYKNNKALYLLKKLKTSFFKTRGFDTKRTDESKILTFDIETFLEKVDGNNVFVPYACGYGYKSGFNYQTRLFYLTDYNNDPEKMLISGFSCLVQKENDGATVYMHNGGKFDIVFLINIFYKIDNVLDIDIIYKDDIFISIVINYRHANEKKKRKLYIQDSYLLLKSSLAKLCKIFEVPVQKLTFPHEFVTRERLNYIGIHPVYSKVDSLASNTTDLKQILGGDHDM